MSCGVGAGVAHLWCMPAAAAPIGPLAWEPPYAAGAALKKKKKKTKTNKQKPHLKMLLALT